MVAQRRSGCIGACMTIEHRIDADALIYVLRMVCLTFPLKPRKVMVYATIKENPLYRKRGGHSVYYVPRTFVYGSFSYLSIDCTKP